MSKEKDSRKRVDQDAAQSREKAAAQTDKEKGGPVAYFTGVRQEMAKVVWPTRAELARDTGIVFAVCAFFALIFWGMDTGFLALLRELLGITLS